jgi:hypothetical protein
MYTLHQPEGQRATSAATIDAKNSHSSCRRMSSDSYFLGHFFSTKETAAYLVHPWVMFVNVPEDQNAVLT